MCTLLDIIAIPYTILRSGLGEAIRFNILNSNQLRFVSVLVQGDVEVCPVCLYCGGREGNDGRARMCG